jgi:hypothetical protein
MREGEPNRKLISTCYTVILPCFSLCLMTTTMVRVHGGKVIEHETGMVVG